MMGYGYENAAGDRISALIDMINGGGPGRSGGTFEGGGILSLLANAVAKPYGSVRERPGHTPMGAAAAPMEVLPVATGAGVEPVETSVLRAADTGGRTFREEDLALLSTLHPDVRALFSGMRPGDPLSPQMAMFLDAARIDSIASGPLSFGPTADGSPESPLSFGFSSERVGPTSSAPLSFGPDSARVGSAAPATGTMSMSGFSEPLDPLVPAPTGILTAQDTAYDSLGDPTFFTPDQLDAMSPQLRAMAEEHNRENLMLAAEVFRVPAAPIVSPLPKPRPAADTASAAGAVPVADAPPTDATAAPIVSPLPKPRPTGQPVTVISPFFDTEYYVYPDRRVVAKQTGRELTAEEFPYLYFDLLKQAGMDASR